MTTLNDILYLCDKVVDIYMEIADNNGMSGDIEGFDVFEEKSRVLQEKISFIREHYDTFKYLSLDAIRLWFELDEDKEIKEILKEALDLYKQRLEDEINKLQKDIDFCNALIC